MDDRKQRFRLGLFVVVSGLLLTGMILLFGGAPQRFFARQDTYTIIFDAAPGITPGTPVRKSGVKIGQVASVQLNDDTGKVHVVIKINKQYTIRTNEEPVISQDLLSRDTSIDFVPLTSPSRSPPTIVPVPPGEPTLKPPEPIKPASFSEQVVVPEPQLPPSPLGEPLPPGAIIRGQPATDTRAIIAQATDILPIVQQSLNAIRRSAERFEQMLPQLEVGVREFAALGRAIREAVPEVRRTNDELRGLLQNVRSTAPGLRKTNEELQLTLRNFSQVGETVNVFVQSNQERFVKVADQATDVLQRVSNVLNDENQKNFTATLRAAQNASANFDTLTRSGDELLREAQKTAKRAQESMNQFDATMATINQAVRPIGSGVEQFNRILSSIGESAACGREGTVQKFFSDPSLYNNLNDAAIMVTRVIPRFDRILRDFEVFADKIARHPESIGIGGAVRPNAGLKESPTAPYKNRP